MKNSDSCNHTYLAVKTCYDYEQNVAYPHIDALKKKNDTLTDHLSKLNSLVQLIHREKEKTSKGNKEPIIDFSTDPVIMDLVDIVREITLVDIHGQTTSFLPTGQYKWNGQSAVDSLINGLESQSKIIYQKISPVYMEMQHEFDKKNHIDEACSNILRQANNSHEHTIRNMAK